MKRAILGFCVLSLTSGCAVVSNLRSGNVAGAAHAVGDEAQAKAGDAMRASQRATKDNKEICEPLKTRPVGFPEERALGGAVLIGTVTGGYFIDKDDEHDAAKLKAKVDSGAKVTARREREERPHHLRRARRREPGRVLQPAHDSLGVRRGGQPRRQRAVCSGRVRGGDHRDDQGGRQ